MAIQVSGPDGVNFEFPDGTDQDEILAFFEKATPSKEAPAPRTESGLAPAVSGASQNYSRARPEYDELFDAIKLAESGGNPAATNPTSSASGPYQITSGNALGPGYGVPPIRLNDRFDEEKSRIHLQNYYDAAMRELGNDPELATVAWNKGIPATKAWVEAGQPNNRFGQEAAAYLGKVKRFMPVTQVQQAAVVSDEIPRPEQYTTNQFLAGLYSGGQQIPKSYGELLEILGVRIGSKDIEQAGETIRLNRGEKQQHYLPEVDSITKVRSLDDLYKWGAYGLGQGLASTSPGVVIGMAAALLTPGTPQAKAIVGLAAGVLGSSYPQNAGDLYSELLEAGVDKDRASKLASAWGIPLAALDMPLAGNILGTVFKAPTTEIKRNLAQRIILEFGRGMLAEGPTEGAQEAIQAGVASSATNREFFTKDTMVRILDASLLGALTGGVVEAPVALINKNLPPAIRKAALEPSEADGLKAFYTPPGSDTVETGTVKGKLTVGGSEFYVMENGLAVPKSRVELRLDENADPPSQYVRPADRPSAPFDRPDARGFLPQSELAIPPEEEVPQANLIGNAKEVNWYSRLDKAIDAIPQAAMTGKQWLATLRNRPGISQLEIDATGLNDYLENLDGVVNKTALRDYLSSNGLDFMDILLKETKGDSFQDVAAYPALTIPGADENSYRELFVTAPAKYVAGSYLDQVPFESENIWRDGHGPYNDIANPIVRIRFNSRNDIMGKKTMFIEEMQPPNPSNFKKMPAFAQKKWAEIGVRRALMWAAKNNVDTITWTAGEVQAQRYKMNSDGLKALYDVKIPNHFEAELRKWGIKVKPTAIPGPGILKLNTSQPMNSWAKVVKDYDRLVELRRIASGMEFDLASLYEQLSNDEKFLFHNGYLIEELFDNSQLSDGFIESSTRTRLIQRYGLEPTRENYGAWQVKLPPEFNTAVRSAGLPKLNLTANGKAAAPDMEVTLKRILENITPGADIRVHPRIINNRDVFIEGVPGGAELGGYQWRNIIAVAANIDYAEASGFHEAVHWLEQQGLFTEDEKTILRREIPRLREIARKFLLEEKTRNITPAYADKVLENESEVLAYAAEKYARLRGDEALGRTFTRVQQKLLEKIDQFFRRLGNYLRGLGFKSAEDIFDVSASGEIGRRNLTKILQEPYNQVAIAEAAPRANMSSNAFGSWFAGSVVTDDIGRPLPMYHGVANPSDTIRESAEAKHEIAGPGIYFAADPDVASAWAGVQDDYYIAALDLEDAQTALKEAKQKLRNMQAAKEDMRDIEHQQNYIKMLGKEIADLIKQLAPNKEFHPTITPAYLAIKNPLLGTHELSLDDRNQLTTIVARLPLPNANATEARFEALGAIEDARDVQELLDNNNKMLGGAVNKWARDNKYDGLKFKMDNWDGGRVDAWVAFNSNQVQSFQRGVDEDIKPNLVSNLAAGLKYMRGKTSFQFQDVDDISLVGDWLSTPRHLASTKAPFTQVYQQGESMRRHRSWITAEASNNLASYGHATEYVKKKVNAAIELARLQGVKLSPNAQGRITIVNTTRDTDFTAVGDAVVLEGAEVEAYKALQRAGAFMLSKLEESLVSSAGKFDISLPEQPAAIVIPPAFRSAQVLSLVNQLQQYIQQGLITNAARAQKIQDAIPNMQRLAGKMYEIEQMAQRDYTPFTRFGEWGVVIEDSQGNALHFETFEGIDGKVGRVLNTGKTMARIEELLRRYPQSRVKTDPATGEQIFRLSYDKIKTMAGSHMLAFDFLASMLGSNSKQAYAQIRPQLEQLIMTRGFPSHLTKSDNLPGYSKDFSRAWANYIVGSSGFIARQQFKGPLEEAIAKIPQGKSGLNRLLKTAIDYRDYIMSPDEEYSFLRGLTFAYNLGGNASSAFLQLLNLPMLSGPYLSQFTNYANANGKWMRAFSQTFGMIGRTTLQASGSLVGQATPLSDNRMLLDPNSSFVTARLKPDEIQVVQQAWEEGTLKPLLAVQQIGLTPGMHGNMPQSARRFWHNVQSNLAAGFGLMETAGRVTQFLAGYRLARDNPSVLTKAAQVFANNPLYQSEMAKATTPREQAFAFATFGIDEIMGQFDKTNRARYQRGVGALFTQFSNWTHQILELFARTMSNQGASGKKAFAYMMLWLIIAGGLQGLPGAENAKDLFEVAWRNVTGKPLDLDLELRELVTKNLKNDYIDSRILADMFARGPARSMGTDISQRGALGRLPLSDLPAAIFGDAEFAANAGPFASVAVGNWRAYKERTQAGEPKIQAAREFLPAFAQNALEAAVVWNTDGYRTRRGTVIVPPEDISTAATRWKALGFTPTDIARAREEEWAKKRIAEAARTGPQQMYSNRLSRILERMAHSYWANDNKGRKLAVAEWNATMKEIREHNERQGDRNETKILPNMRSIMDDALLNLKPEMRQIKRAPIRARQAVSEVRGSFPER